MNWHNDISELVYQLACRELADRGDVTETPPTDLFWPAAPHAALASDSAEGEADPTGVAVERPAAAPSLAEISPAAPHIDRLKLPVVSVPADESIQMASPESAPVVASASEVAPFDFPMGPNFVPRLTPLAPVVVTSRHDSLRVATPPTAPPTGGMPGTGSEWSAPPHFERVGSPGGTSPIPPVHESLVSQPRRASPVARADEQRDVAPTSGGESPAREAVGPMFESLLERRLASQQTAFDQLRERVEEHERLWLEQNALRRIAAPRF